MRHKYCILLTGCVNPDGMARTKLQDIDIRRQQYLDAIRFYHDTTKYPIVFCENSMSDLSGYFPKRDKDRIEFLTFNGNDYNKERGKSLGEANIIEYALTTSQLLKKPNLC